MYFSHPFFQYQKVINTGNKCDYYSTCIRRIDFDVYRFNTFSKHSNFSRKENIYMFGAENRLYVHHKLKDMNFD